MARPSHATAAAAVALYLTLTVLQTGCQALSGWLDTRDEAATAADAGALIGGIAGGPAGSMLGEAVGYAAATVATAYALHKRRQNNRLRSTLNGRYAGDDGGKVRTVRLTGPTPNSRPTVPPPRRQSPTLRRPRR